MDSSPVTDAVSAILAPNGRVIASGQGWPHHVGRHGGPGCACPVGDDCIAAAEAAAAAGWVHAAHALAGLRAVLGGTKERFTIEHPCHAGHGRRWLALEVIAAEGGAGALLNHRDVTAQREAAHARAAGDETDPATGLPGRTAVLEAITGASDPAVAFLDLDGFHLVEDRVGHAGADRILRAVAHRLTEMAGRDALVARVGDDEFVVVVSSGGVRAGEAMARRLLSALPAPVDLDGTALIVHAVAGVAGLRAELSAADVLQDAHLAVYRAKQLGPGHVVRFDPELREAGRRRAELESALRRALVQDELVLHYQPLVRMDGTLIGAEALVRWDRPGSGLVPPGDFIGLAEETGLVVPLGEWALREACRQAAAWHEGGFPLEIAVNVSPVQLRDGRLPDAVAEALAASGLPPASLCLEITETALVDFDEDTGVLDALKALGVRLAIDDFGTGWSSLAALRRLPFDVVKLDRCFVGGIEEDAGDRAIVAAIVGLAHTLGRAIVAEGIETAGCAKELRRLGADYGQGWHFGRPAPAAIFCEWLVGSALAA